MQQPIMMTLDDAAEALGAELHGAGDAGFVGVSTDSRAVQAGDLFVALRGERFDGHEFLGQAVASGAVAALVGRIVEGSRVPLLRVEDTRLALGRLAAYWRGRHAIPLVALTGSNGKTTVKEMLASILRDACGSEAAVLATQGNLNNDIGMPLTLLRLRAEHRYAVIELGMNHLGEIEYLSRIARPDVALVNNAQRAHVGELGSLEAVARAKGEIFSGLKKGGVAVINADDPFAALWRKLAEGRKQLWFGLDHGTVSGRFEAGATGSEIRVTTPLGEFTAHLGVPGEHNVRNALAASAAAVALGVSPRHIHHGLERFGGVRGRLQRRPGLNGAILIDDSYNANPDSVAAALSVLARAGGETIFVLGDMGELGADAPAMHAEVGRLARQQGIGRLFALGELSARAVETFGVGAQHFDSAEALVEALQDAMGPGVSVLVKGSRFMRMERVVEAVAEKGSA